MKKGAVPIPYIIALLLGISVVAILGYWFFVLGGRWGGEVSLQNCRNRALTYCQGWQNAGYANDGGDPVSPVPHGWFGRTAGPDDTFETYATECARFRGDLGFSTGFSLTSEQSACEEILLTTP